MGAGNSQSVTGKANASSPSDDRFFFYVLLALSVVFTIGFSIVMVVVNQSHGDGNIGPGDSPSVAIAPDHPRQLADFSLTNWTGSNVTRAEVKGRFLVVDFLFTSCSVTCPFINDHMAQIQELTTNQPDVKLVSLTVDPRDDTPPVLAKYAKRFKADPRRWLLLTGDRDEVYGLIRSFLNQDADNSFGYMPGNFTHTDRIAIVDRQGAIRAYFDGLSQNTPGAVLNEIAALRKGSL